ncbi:MAG TPA: hypothetical protein VIH89_02130 [Candidatus Sulfotelmatobacter sp.]|jgi:hypothetical protein
MNQLNNALPARVSSSSSSEWKQLYERALLEVDGSKLRNRIESARHAIFDRAEEIITDPSGEEHRALNDALRILRVLDVEAKKENNAT